MLVADDHEVVRQGLAALLREQPDIQFVGEAANGREAVDMASRLRPDVVIMDVAMPLMNGDEATRQTKMHLPGTRVIALSMYAEDGMVEKMRRAGAEPTSSRPLRPTSCWPPFAAGESVRNRSAGPQKSSCRGPVSMV